MLPTANDPAGLAREVGDLTAKLNFHELGPKGAANLYRKLAVRMDDHPALRPVAGRLRAVADQLQSVADELRAIEETLAAG